MRISAIISGILLGIVTAKRSVDRWNWSHNIEFSAKYIEQPATVEELQSTVKNATGKVKVVGTAHSFNDIADTEGTQINLDKFNDISVDLDTFSVTFGAGINYSKLIKALTENKMSLLGLPSLPHINIVGSVVTGTHSAGLHKQQMATYVSAISFVDPHGQIKKLTRKEHNLMFYRHLHSFGTLGIIYEMTMDIYEEYGVDKCIYQNMPWDVVKDKKKWKQINNEHGFISYFTDWKSETMSSVWIGSQHFVENGNYDADHEKHYTESCPETYYGGQLIQKIHPVNDRDSEPCVESGFGMWNEKIYHFKPELPPSSAGDEIQSEFFVEKDHFLDALLDLYHEGHLFRDYVQITEIRGVQMDFIPLSPFKHRNSFGIHFTWKHDFENVYKAAKEVQRILKPYDYRVHYGKFFHPEPDNGLFKSFNHDLGELRQLIQNQGNSKFINCFAERVLYDNQNCQLDSNYERWAAELEEKIAREKHSDEL